MSALSGIDIALWDLKGKPEYLLLTYVELTDQQAATSRSLYTNFSVGRSEPKSKYTAGLEETALRMLKQLRKSNNHRHFSPYLLT